MNPARVLADKIVAYMAFTTLALALVTLALAMIWPL